MISKETTLELGSQEEVVAIIRRGWLAQAGRVLLLIIWILLPFFFFFPLLSFGAIGLLVFVGLAGSGILYASREWHMWYHTMWVITDSRLIDIDQLGWTEREVHEVALRKIKRVHIKRDTVGAKIFRYATMWIETRSSHTYDVELEGVQRAKHLKRLLRDLKKAEKSS